jgi:hypothetical protein
MAGQARLQSLRQGSGMHGHSITLMAWMTCGKRLTLSPGSHPAFSLRTPQHQKAVDSSQELCRELEMGQPGHLGLPTSIRSLGVLQNLSQSSLPHRENIAAWGLVLVTLPAL